MKLLVVGLGSMGKRRARLLAGLGHAVAGVDSAAERRAEAGALGIEAYESLPAALSAGGCAAALVCTAPLSHAAIISELLDAGLPVFTELNLVADGYEGLMAKAKAKNLVLFLSSTMLYRAETNYIAKAVADFKRPLDYIYHIGQYLPDWHPWESIQNFFVGEKRTGGVREILGIELPWLVSAFGPVAGASADWRSLSDLPLPYPDSLRLTLRHQNGTRGFLAADVVCPKAVRNLEVYGQGLQLFWEGSPTSLSRWDPETKQKLAVDAYAGSGAEQDPRYSDNIVENAYVDELLAFFEVLAGRAAPRWSFEQDLEVIRLMDGLEGPGAEAGGGA